jgi:hypothetical protein
MRVSSAAGLELKVALTAPTRAARALTAALGAIGWGSASKGHSVFASSSECFLTIRDQVLAFKVPKSAILSMSVTRNAADAGGGLTSNT